jgi:GT2 family glycosyltransferase
MSAAPGLASAAEEATPDGGTVLSIIISSYNTRDVLADCLRSIERHRPTGLYEIILVDDASVDGTSEMVRTQFPAVRLLRNEENRHYTASNNRALHQARGQYVLLLNSDTVVLPDALDDMVAFLGAHPEAGAVGCKLLNEDGSIQWSVKSLPGPLSALFGARSFITRLWPNNPLSRRHLLHLSNDMTRPFSADGGYISGAAAMMPRRVVQEVGDLDTDFFFHVDADYCKRITDAGYRCFYLPTASIIHLNHRGGSMPSLLARFRSLMMLEVYSYRFYRKHMRRSPWSPMQGLVVAGLFCHFLALAAGEGCGILIGLARRMMGQRRASLG